MLSLMNSSFNNEVKLSKKIIMPTPYGSIPKRTKKQSSKKSSAVTTTRKNSLSTPYPCFSLAPTSSSFFVSIFNNLFSTITVKEDKPVGFMPCSTDKIQMSQLVDIAVNSSNPIDCTYNDKKDQDTVSNNSSSSSESSLSSIFSNYMDSFNEQEESQKHESTDILSDILCDHYVQTQQQMSPPSLSEQVRDVPLETFRMFESTTTEDRNWMSPMDELEDTKKEWKLISSEKQVVEEIEKEQTIPPVETDDVSPKTAYHTRDIRANAAYLRMIVAEVNMMRSQKIVGPLRPRRILPKRSDSFMHRPSPLQMAA